MTTGEYDDYFDGDDDAASVEELKTVEEETPEQIEAKKIKAQTIGRKDGSLRKAIMTMIAVAVFVMIVWIVVIFWLPYVSEAQQRGVIMQVRQEGLIFKTFEGQMITDERIADTTHIYQRDFIFSIENDSIARKMMELQATGRRVVVTYKEYRGTLPWRGSSKIVVTDYRMQ